MTRLNDRGAVKAGDRVIPDPRTGSALRVFAFAMLIGCALLELV